MLKLKESLKAQKEKEEREKDGKSSVDINATGKRDALSRFSSSSAKK